MNCLFTYFCPVFISNKLVILEKVEEEFLVMISVLHIQIFATNSSKTTKHIMTKLVTIKVDSCSLEFRSLKLKRGNRVASECSFP